MKTHGCVHSVTALGFAALMAFLMTPPLIAHCDGLDGPVVKAAQRALAEGNVNLALIWVQEDDEAEIKRIFENAWRPQTEYRSKGRGGHVFLRDARPLAPRG